MFAKQMKMSARMERVDWNKSFDSKKDGVELKGTSCHSWKLASVENQLDVKRFEVK